jgi:pilus assembly protein CpaB
MSPVRLIILVVAAVAAIGAVFIVRSMQAPSNANAAAPAAVAPPVPTKEVLVAKRPIPLGKYINVDDLKWEAWPEEAATGTFIEKTAQPEALEGFVGAFARAPMVEGEPIVATRLVHPGDAGFMAAILGPGMRAVTMRISEDSAASGFILPDDRVDVLLTRRIQYATEGNVRTDVILTNVRVIAIDATYTSSTPEQGAVMPGSRATLELSESDAGLLRSAQDSGAITLTLRSMADLQDRPGATTIGRNLRDGIGAEGESIRVYRYGVQTNNKQEP